MKEIFVDVKYIIKDGKREEFINKLVEEQIIENSRQEIGNIKYQVSLSVDSSNVVCITELWTNQEEQKKHSQTEHYEKLAKLKKQYVEAVEICSYQVEKM